MDVHIKPELTLLELSLEWVLIAINFTECQFFTGMRLFVIYFAIILFHMSSK